MNYREQRNYLNLQHAMYEGAGRFEMPQLDPVQANADNWIGFNYCKGCEDPEVHGVHFFLDDYQFERVWECPDRYCKMLSRFQAVMTPDFSLYTDFPKAVQIYNSYRRHWLGRYWQDAGLTVIPTISWSTPDSYDWCFDGDPVHSTVAVSSVGTLGEPETAELFLSGYREMLQRLEPSQVLFYGVVPPGIDPSTVVQIMPFWKQIKQRVRGKNVAGQVTQDEESVL